jgi:hypothetical protein
MSNQDDPKRDAKPEADGGSPQKSVADRTGVPADRNELFPLPGLIAISFYLLLLAVVIVVGVVGGHYPRTFVVLPVFLFAACGGLLMRFRWSWAMALAAVLLLGCYNLWIFARLHFGASLIQGLLNLVFFFYLVRTEVREKLR